MKKTGAVLVAAGMSSRMKGFKPMLPYGDSTIALHVVSVLEELGIAPIVVVTGHRADELKEHLSCTCVRFVKNERYKTSQMFESVKLGIESIERKCDRLMVMPLDIPAIAPETFRRMLAVDAEIVRNVHEGRHGHPIIMTVEAAKQVCQYTGPDGLRGAVEHSGIPVTRLQVEDPAVCWKIDTQQDYQKLLRWNYRQGNGYPVRPHVQVRLVTQEKFFGPGVAQLFQLIEQTGSLQEACGQMGLSYSKGSKMIKNAEDQLGIQLIQRWAGGSGGGGSVLTDEGKLLLQCYHNFVSEIRDHTEKLYEEYFIKGFWEKL